VRSPKRVENAAVDLAAIFEGHFAKLPPDERESRTRAFDCTVAKLGSRAKLAVPPAPPGNRRADRRP
jgi:hypothetical protein